MRKIPLTRGYTALVEDRDFERVMAVGSWQSRPGRCTHHPVYAVHSCRKLGHLYLHRFILGITDRKIEVDHRDRNGLHCWRDNLRVATRSQNCGNQSKRRGGYSSQYRGVSWCKRERKWRATITRNGKFTTLGYFSDERSAARAYDDAARQHYGVFVNPNFRKLIFSGDGETKL
jgi:AP2 domain